MAREVRDVSGREVKGYTLRVRVGEELRKKLERVARAKQVSVSDVVRMCLVEMPEEGSGRDGRRGRV